MSKFYADLLERMAWTAVQAALGLVTVQVFGLPDVYVPIIAVVLSTVKGFVARQIGDTGSASTVPSV